MKFHKLLWKEFFLADTGRLAFFVIANFLVLLTVIGCPIWIVVTDSVEENAILPMLLLFGGILILWIIFLGLSVYFTIHRQKFPRLYECFRFFRRS